MTGKPFTGRKMFIITASAFAVIIAVNLYMAAMAVGTFPGLETRNSYVASQRFDVERKAQLALGWAVAATLGDGVLRLTITDADGRPVQPPMLSATLGRATEARDDIELGFRFDGRSHLAAADLAPGKWDLRLRATAADGTAFRQRIALYVGKGT